jgi:hypothetical protein
MTFVGYTLLYRKRNYDILKKFKIYLSLNLCKSTEQICNVCKKNWKLQNTKRATTHKPKVKRSSGRPQKR